MKHTYPLEPDHAEMVRTGRLVLGRAVDFIESLPDRPAFVADEPDARGRVGALLVPPPEGPQELSELLDRIDAAAGQAIETTGPGFLGYVPTGGLYAGALADLYKSALNRYSTLAAAAPGITAIEESVVRWIARDVFGLPGGSGGLLTSGGSMANFSAVIAARTARTVRSGANLSDATIYVSEQTHHSVGKAAILAGFSPYRIRVVPGADDLRMDPVAVADMIKEDHLAGLRPTMLVATAGSTDTGTVDPLHRLADLAAREGMWFHVDAAYGGFFALTERGRARLAGIERADSITADPHKSLFLPLGVGAILVRDRTRLATEQLSAPYLDDVTSDDLLPDYADLGPELTREARGLRVWLPLHLHGIRAFRDALDEKLDLATIAFERLRAIPELDLPWTPELSTVAFRVRAEGRTGAAARRADERTTRLLEQVNASRRVYLSSTVIRGRKVIRMCILSHRTHRDRVDEALDLVEKALAGL
ncbi:aminotransferase class V-fold PLP-dependent enzyme [Micromonospora musae]|uniref:Aminotransferase class V-fold PLP-dependent enzyme n=1 Tax=Micromonospora musae TaxID=1894970 RepID=A0ABX9REB9_9ACTN|nr:aminotransferase class V-fold PLP-dependent enzyme [Micromonospora musae]